MALAANTGSTLTLPSGKNKTSTGLSTHIVIMVNGQVVGAIQSLQITEQRPVKQIVEVGSDGSIDSTPSASTIFTGTCTRVRYDRLRLSEAFGRAWIHVASQAYPFDIVILDKQKRDNGSQISTVIKNVWFTNLQWSVTSTEWVVSETAQFVAERVYSTLNNGSTPVAQGGEIGIKHTPSISGGNGTINIEQLADTGSGGRGGSLDFGGLIDIGSDVPGIF